MAAAITHRIINRIPMPTAWRLRFRRALFDRAYLRDLEAAEGDKQAVWDDWRFTFMELDDEEAVFHTRRLLTRARDLRIPRPPQYEGKSLSSDWEENEATGTCHLSSAGERRLLAAIREEEKLRTEQRARFIPYLTALTGLVGTITGLVALLLKLHP